MLKAANSHDRHAVSGLFDFEFCYGDAIMFTKFIGITQELSTLIEGRRKNPDQAEHEILL